MTQKIPQNMPLMITISIYLLLCLPGLASSEDKPNGTLWITFNDLTKAIYIAGFFDGMHLGYNFSYWGFSKSTEIGPCTEKVITSYSDYYRKYLSNVSIKQIVDGLDSFYKDLRNLRILIPDAVWLVVNSIAGMPEEDFEKMVEDWRQNIPN